MRIHLGEMPGRRLGGRFLESLDEVDALDVRLHVLTPGRDILRIVLPPGLHTSERLAQPGAHLVHE